MLMAASTCNVATLRLAAVPTRRRPPTAVRVAATAPRAGRRTPHATSDVTADTLAQLNDALSGNPRAVNALVDRLTPVIQARIARLLLRGGTARDVRQDVSDYAQDIFLHLFDNGGQVLKQWSPERGMSLDNYVGLIAERRTISALRSGRRNPWREDQALDDHAEPTASQASPERQTTGRDTLTTLLDWLKAHLSPQGWQLFDLLYVQERSVDEVQTVTGLSPDAVYAWRSRLRKAARKGHEAITAVADSG